MTKKNTCCIVFGGLIVLLSGGLVYCLFQSESPVPNQYRIPTVSESERLTLNTTLEFGEAIQAGNLSLFRNTTSDAFKRAFSEAEFEQAFNGFIEQRINLLAVNKQKAILTTAPAMTADGTLILRGYFPTQPSRVYFDYSYVRQNGAWLLSGIDVTIRPLLSDHQND